MRKSLAEHAANYAARPVERYAWAGCAVVAPGFALASDVAPHKVWGFAAGAGYAVAALLMSGSGARRRARAAAVLGAVVVPLVGLVTARLGQLEVAVVERSGRLLATTGSPYVTDPSAVADFNPYLPGMALFGLLPGDARWWLGAVFVAALAGAGLHSAWLLACPLVALPLAVGGVDLPVVGLMCLGVSLAGQRRTGPAGLVLGAAAVLKWTAWPAFPVVLALITVRQGGRAALRCAAVGLSIVTVSVLPFVLADPHGFYLNVAAFPLGLTGTASPAASPLPGHLLAAHVPGGTLIAPALLSAAALLFALSLAVRPPGTVRDAGGRLALGLAVATALMPATRFGYLVYPLVLGALAHRSADRGTAVTPSEKKEAIA
ncbi:hypothetical protein ACFFKE_16665 [Streptomyces mutabilis]|uniref:hypothetical protein n=1 Tax=Streptomyces mutabilis TaxID=67332 RepID=UPI001785772D|nr:hypothetical protein [Streptomyces mutabilis]GGQ39278.1 hypothetical protein GCM10010279_55800 [Streptomyces mutabilis]